MTALDLRVGEIEARLAAATPGPWAWSRSRPFGPDVPPRFEMVKPVLLGEFNGIPMHGHPLNIIKSDNEWQPNDSDAEFIANAPADVAYLLAELRKAHEALAAVSAIEEVLDGWDALVPFRDAEESQRWYSLGKRHAAERIRTEIAEARAAVAAANGDGQ